MTGISLLKNLFTLEKQNFSSLIIYRKRIKIIKKAKGAIAKMTQLLAMPILKLISLIIITIILKMPWKLNLLKTLNQ